MHAADQIALVDAFEKAASSSLNVAFVSDDAAMSMHTMWKRARPVAGWLRSAETVATMLLTSPDSVILLLGAVRAGITLVSLPLPPRGTGSERYPRTLTEMLASSRARVLVVDASLRALIPPLDMPVLTLDDLMKTRPVEGCGAGFELMQFSSGTTGDPKGIVLPEAAITSNLVAILDRVKPDERQALVSWLPLSHDMGLIGALLTSLYALGSLSLRESALVLMRPEHFIRSPRDWLLACTEYRATVTMSPDFGFRRVLDRDLSGVELGSLTTCLTGSEPVRRDTLERVDTVLGALGLSDTAICPAYGCAEATLAVSIARPLDKWHARQLQAVDGDLEPAVTQTIVSSGPPVRGTEVSIDGAPGSVGSIRIRSDSLTRAYSDESDPLDQDGWFRTNDLGAVVDGELYVLGRTDDVVIAAGRNLSGNSIREKVEMVDGVRRGTVSVVTDPQVSGYLVAFEVSTKHLAPLLRAMQEALRSTTPIGPNGYVVARDGTMPRTPSGKPRRFLVEEAIRRGDQNFDIIRIRN